VNSLAISHSSDRSVCHGYNTDVFGITESLRAAGQIFFDHAAIIGGGATALSALVALEELGFQRVSVALRNPNKDGALSSLANRLGIDVSIVELGAIDSLAPVDVAISTVPGSAELRFDSLPRTSSAILLDVAYDVWPSPRSSEWMQSGGTAISGLSMLAFQAIKQVRIFVADAPDAALPNETAVREAMFTSVGLNQFGL
jgi:shikimate dehydrogenase